MSTMRAVQLRALGGPETLELCEVQRPVPAPGEVLIDVAAIGVNFADVQMRQGSYPIPLELPVVLGGEVAGRIAEVGDGVDAALRGRRVAAMVQAGYAEWVVAPADRVVELPDALSDAEAAALLVCGLTAQGILEAGALADGDTVLVQAAAGGVGGYLVQLARITRAGAIVATASSPAKLDAARALGADVTVDYTRAGWDEEVRAAVGAVDLALETTGGVIAAQSLALLRQPGGRMVYYGGTSGEPPEITPFDLVFRNATLRGYALPPYLDADPGHLQRGARRLLDLVLDGALRVPIAAELPMADVGKAHALLEGRTTIGKLVLVP